MTQTHLDSRRIKPGRYRHFKGGEYQVIDIAYHSDDEALLVLYRPLYGEGQLWVRPFDQFNETVVHQGKMVPRFAPIVE